LRHAPADGSAPVVRQAKERFTMMTTTSATIASPGAASRGPSDTIRPSVIQRIQAEYAEMPGLTLTLPQAARLWGLDVGQSERLLSELAGF
jgi:hypothetical protein